MTDSYATVNGRPTHTPATTGWAGWVLFAGTIMLMSGVFQVIAGFVALFRDSYYAVRSDDLLVTVGYTGWGWVHIIVGAAVALTGLAVMAGRLWAHVVCVALAVVSAIVNLGFLSAYPVGATITIALDVVVIFAITVHGREVRS